MYFLNPRSHAIPSFISSKILPIHLLYFEAILHSMYDVSNNYAPKDISDKFVKTSLIHSYNTRAASCGKYHIKFSRLNQQRNSFSCFGTLSHVLELFLMFWRESMELSPISSM